MGGPGRSPVTPLEPVAGGSVDSLPSSPFRRQYTGADGLPFWIAPLNVDSSEEVDFVSSRLEREAGAVWLSLRRTIFDPAKVTVFAARKCLTPLAKRQAPESRGDGGRLVEDSRSEAESTGDEEAWRLVGLLVLDTSTLPYTEAAGISWVSVLFPSRGNHVGRHMVRHAEQCARERGARWMQVPGILWGTKLFKHMGYFARNRAIPSTPRALVYPDLRCCYKALRQDEASDAPPPAKGQASSATMSATASCESLPQRPSAKRCRAAAVAARRVRRRRPRKEPSSSSDESDESDESKALEESEGPSSSSSSDGTKTTASREEQAAESAPKRRRQQALSTSEESARAASRQLSSKHSKGEGRLSAREMASRRRRTTEYFSYHIPGLPVCVADGSVVLRMASPENKRSWNSLLLAACQYNMGGSSMMQVTWEAACRIVALDAADLSTVVGLVSMQESGWVSFIACDPAFRAAGLGSFMLFLAMEWLRVRDGKSVTLTPLNRKVMQFYDKWGFETFAADDRKRSTGLSASDLVMSRHIDREVRLLPEGKPLSHFVANYDASDEAVDTSTWCYYFYTVPERKKAKDTHAEKADARKEEDGATGAPVPRSKASAKTKAPPGRGPSAAPAAKAKEGGAAREDEGAVVSVARQHAVMDGTTRSPPSEPAGAPAASPGSSRSPAVDVHHLLGSFLGRIERAMAAFRVPSPRSFLHTEQAHDGGDEAEKEDFSVAGPTASSSAHEDTDESDGKSSQTDGAIPRACAVGTAGCCPRGAAPLPALLVEDDEQCLHDIFESPQGPPRRPAEYFMNDIFTS